jgi:hypothetical protein
MSEVQPDAPGGVVRILGRAGGPTPLVHRTADGPTADHRTACDRRQPLRPRPYGVSPLPVPRSTFGSCPDQGVWRLAIRADFFECRVRHWL